MNARLVIEWDDGRRWVLGNGEALAQAEDDLIAEIVGRISAENMIAEVRAAVAAAAAHEKFYRRARAAGESLGDEAGRVAVVILRSVVEKATREALLAFKHRTTG